MCIHRPNIFENRVKLSKSASSNYAINPFPRYKSKAAITRMNIRTALSHAASGSGNTMRQHSSGSHSPHLQSRSSSGSSSHSRDPSPSRHRKIVLLTPSSNFPSLMLPPLGVSACDLDEGRSVAYKVNLFLLHGPVRYLTIR